MERLTNRLEKIWQQEGVKYKRHGHNLKWRKVPRTANCALCKKHEVEEKNDQSFPGWMLLINEINVRGNSPEICPDCTKVLTKNAIPSARMATCMKCGNTQREKIYGIGFPGWKIPFVPPKGITPDSERIDNLYCPPCSIELARKLGKTFVHGSWNVISYATGSLLTSTKMTLNQDNFLDPGNVIHIATATGITTMPLQPSFLVHPAVAQLNFAVNVLVPIVFGTEIFDIGANFATPNFTAPVTGKYQFNVTLVVANILIGAASYEIRLVTTNRSYNYRYDPTQFAGNITQWPLDFSILADMTVGHTAYIGIFQSGGAQASDITVNSWFSGFLVG